MAISYKSRVNKIRFERSLKSLLILQVSCKGGDGGTIKSANRVKLRALLRGDKQTQKEQVGVSQKSYTEVDS